MSIISLRLDDDLTDAIDALAKAAGMTRSAWISRAIKDALPARREEMRDIPTSDSESKMLSLRFPSDELAAMEVVARRAGLTRAQWIKRTLRWQLWNRAGELRLIPSSHRSIVKLVAQVRAIGRSLNQAVKAMNAANRPESAIEIHAAARSVIEIEGRLSEVINQAASDLTMIVSGEVSYWTNGKRQAPAIMADES